MRSRDQELDNDAADAHGSVDDLLLSPPESDPTATRARESWLNAEVQLPGSVAGTVRARR